MAAPEDTASGRIVAVDEHADLPAAAVAALATITSALVGGSVYAAIESGYTALGLGFLAAAVLFVAAVGVFEAGRRLGARPDS